MPHDVTLITTIAAGLGLALVLGYLATRIGVPPLVGYLVAGIVAGPATPGFVADIQLTSQLAEIGVMLMMFGVGPRIEVLIRTHSDEEADLLRQEKLGDIFMGEHELAQAMTREVLSRFHVKHEHEMVPR
jgi:hypothetical protein